MPAGSARRRAVLSDDTDPEIEARQVAVWRALSSVEIAALINAASRAARTLAAAGLRDRYPRASPHELALRLATLTLGADLAARAYPQLRHLDP
jgi:hypothetical protein